MDANGVNYYKGVLLCSRPNQSPSIQKEKPFCGRVFPHESIGLVPTKNYDQHHVKKRVLPVLNNHKKWLEGFKKKVEGSKVEEQIKKEKQFKKLEKIKQEAHKIRQDYKKGIVQEQSEFQVPKEVQEPEKHHRMMKKGDKPAWAKTQQQVEAQQQKQVDELLNFFETSEVKDYLGDEEVNKMLKDLKERISSMKNEEGDEQNWKKKQMKKYQQQKVQSTQERKNDKDDVLSRISRQSGAQSVASQKTAERVQQLEKKKQEKQWDKYSTTQKKSHANIDEQIAKNVADEVLRNYPALKNHSNQSIRKLLQKQAHQEIKA